MLDCLVVAICYFQLFKNDVWKLLLGKEMEWCWKLLITKFSKLWHYQIIWYLFADCKTVNLCSVHSIWFMKFFAEIWLVKNSTRIINTNHELSSLALVFYWSLVYSLTFYLSKFKFSQRRKIKKMSWDFHENYHGKPENITGFFFRKSWAPCNFTLSITPMDSHLSSNVNVF